MNIPEELKYTKSHEWVKEEDGFYVVGLTDYAQEELSDLVFVNLPEVGDEVEAGETFADVESVKAASDVYSPVTGTVAEINEEKHLCGRVPSEAEIQKMIDQAKELPPRMTY